ncbi:MAG: (Na+)-NQR maturation NqrM [Thiothrix sp.]|nr:MAG: (Na+)-NQR maturation NqrM [Thiothrix sp.]
MLVFVIAFAVFLVAFAALSITWFFNRETIKGSCGGLASLLGDEGKQCGCKKPCEKRLKQLEQAAQGVSETRIDFKA